MDIVIRKSPTADSRSCDPSKVTLEQLQDSTKQHMNDVLKGMVFFSKLITKSGMKHDLDKLSSIDEFHKSFQSNTLMNSEWLQNHYKNNRHHLVQEVGIPKDVNLVDVLEYISDCVMAGMARSGNVFDLNISPELLKKAFDNTVILLRSNVKVIDEQDTDKNS